MATRKPSIFHVEKRLLTRIPYPVIVGGILVMAIASRFSFMMRLLEEPKVAKIMRFAIKRGRG